MSDANLPPLHAWLIEPMDAKVKAMVDRIRRAPDIQHVAIMPDVHVANDVTIGTVLATDHLIYPQAVGGDIGCGVLAVKLDFPIDSLRDPTIAGKILAGIGRVVPSVRRHRRHAIAMPAHLRTSDLSDASLRGVLRDEGSLQFATLGSGNHFIELQADESDHLWLCIHSGSRAMGQAIRAHHLAHAEPMGSGLFALDARTEVGQAYLNDANWARLYASENRLAMAQQVESVVRGIVECAIEWNTLIHIDHNHVQLESHLGTELFVHRKGSMPANEGHSGVIPSSMGTQTFHVEGRGCEMSLRSSAHGAGRLLSRTAARQSIHQYDLKRQMRGVWYDYRLAGSLLEEAPLAYKDIHHVLRAQRELVKVIRMLRPVLNYKGR